MSLWLKVWAPASIGNVGPGFDVLGMAVKEFGDAVSVHRSDHRGIRIVEIEGAEGLPLDPRENTAGIAAQEVLRLTKRSVGIELRLKKGVPGSGLGSSAASAVAAAFAVNELLGRPLDKTILLRAALEAEYHVSGARFLDNVGASLYGGVVVADPLRREVLPLGTVSRAVIVLLTPAKKVSTRLARQVLPKKVPLQGAISNLSKACQIVAAVAQNDVALFGASIQDFLIEPHRARLIPGFQRVKTAALQAGALGCAISGAGSTIFAVCGGHPQGARVGLAMRRAFPAEASFTITSIDSHGARRIA
ncbi:MAG: homoserine kinase [Deltaproteobacteria bacterium]|nr:homoserine kinase [Deltaproteobacteria bacterium]